MVVVGAEKLFPLPAAAFRLTKTWRRYMGALADHPGWRLPALLGGAAAGTALAVMAHTGNDTLVALLPFVVATVTGVAKNTTA